MTLSTHCKLNTLTSFWIALSDELLTDQRFQEKFLEEVESVIWRNPELGFSVFREGRNPRYPILRFTVGDRSIDSVLDGFFGRYMRAPSFSLYRALWGRPDRIRLDFVSIIIFFRDLIVHLAEKKVFLKDHGLSLSQLDNVGGPLLVLEAAVPGFVKCVLLAYLSLRSGGRGKPRLDNVLGLGVHDPRELFL